jgi:hypothetical protein
MRIAKLEDQIKVYRKDLALIGETLWISGDPDGYYVKSEPLFNRGSLGRAIFDALRRSLEGLDRHAVAEAVARANSIDMKDDQLAPLVTKRVNDALYRYLHKGELVNRKGPHGLRIWQIAP